MADVTDITSDDDISTVREDKKARAEVAGRVGQIRESMKTEILHLTSLPSHCSIYRVPKSLLKTKPEAYGPRMVSIGPFHRHKKHLKPMEAHKLRYFNDFIHRCESQATLDKFVEAIIRLEVRAQQCYSEIIQLKFKDEFVKMMLIDGCFILELILRTTYGHHRKSEATWMSHVIKCDLILLENQIPFFVLESLYQVFRRDSKFNYETLDKLISNFFKYFLPERKSITPRRSTISELLKKFSREVARKLSAKRDREGLLQPLLMTDEDSVVGAVEEEPERSLGRYATTLAVAGAAVEYATTLAVEEEPELSLVGEAVEYPKTLAVEEEPELSLWRSSKVGAAVEYPKTLAVEEEPELSLWRSRKLGAAVEEEPELSFTDSFSGVAVGAAVEYATTLAVEEEPEVSLIKVEHLLDFIRDLLLQSSPKKSKNPGKYVYTHCATELKEAGVKFKKQEAENTSLLDITFKNGVLKIPTINIEDGTESLLRNLIAFEQYRGCDNHITDYAFFMDGLINSHKDVELLEKNGIIESLLGEPEEVAKLFNGLLKEVVLKGESYSFSGDCEELEKYYKIPWHNWTATFMLNYCSSPWSCISIFAASLLLILTVAQTICSILSLT
ncbi:uncharacterized protein LOC122071264 isoform X2 [Macadamia integrifolia]|nr:uncharacterized protein LOC122071264 isoform X2 [Macadamia integrifolia]XP_042491524.1 uncharacterized protein LOC122071264 isoform X2 [Macadamia integrifolia]XP_042491525.1 uncharacterized protein LOC122071264 isoform X2 [Macadamia integrifolia]